MGQCVCSLREGIDRVDHRGDDTAFHDLADVCELFAVRAHEYEIIGAVMLTDLFADAIAQQPHKLLQGPAEALTGGERQGRGPEMEINWPPRFKTFTDWLNTSDPRLLSTTS